MKKLILAVLLLASNVFASGKLQVKGDVDKHFLSHWPTNRSVGLSVWEPLGKATAVNLWTGYGEDLDEGKRWLVSKGELNLLFGKRLTVSPGVELRKDLVANTREVTGTVAVALQLW